MRTAAQKAAQQKAGQQAAQKAAQRMVIRMTGHHPPASYLNKITFKSPPTQVSGICACVDSRSSDGWCQPCLDAGCREKWKEDLEDGLSPKSPGWSRCQITGIKQGGFPG